MQKLVQACVLLCLLAGPAAAGEFVGTLKFVDEPRCHAKEKCMLSEKFSFVEPGYEWVAPKDSVTDGASIPKRFRDWIGQPFDDDLVKAAVIHDHYCLRRVRSWRQTHRAFYDALLTAGVVKRRARLMYAAVLLGGPKWIIVEKGVPCSPSIPGNDCVLSTRAGVLALPGVAGLNADGKRLSVREARYGDDVFMQELDALEAQFDQATDGEDPAAIEALAAKIRPDDEFYKLPSTVVQYSTGVDQ